MLTYLLLLGPTTWYAGDGDVLRFVCSFIFHLLPLHYLLNYLLTYWWQWWGLLCWPLRLHLLVTSDNKAEVMWSFCRLFCHTANKITDKCGNGRRMAGMCNGWPCRSDQRLVVIRICMWIPDQFFIFFTIAESGIFGHLLAFLIQSPAVLGKITDADKIMHPQHFQTDLTDLLIRKSGFESRITFFVEILASAEVCALWMLLLLLLLLFYY